jgi:hypothetical protein
MSVARVLFAMFAAAASPNEYCYQDPVAGMRECSFATIEQCKEMSSGIGGECYRDPFLARTNSAYAYRPQHFRFE